MDSRSDGQERPAVTGRPPTAGSTAQAERPRLALVPDVAVRPDEQTDESETPKPDEGAERPDLSNGPDSFDATDRAERFDRPDRDEQSDPSDWGGRPDRFERPNRHGQSDPSDWGGRADRFERPNRHKRSDPSDWGIGHERPEGQAQPDPSEQTDRFERPTSYDWNDGSGQDERLDQHALSTEDQPDDGDDLPLAQTEPIVLPVSQPVSPAAWQPHWQSPEGLPPDAEQLSQHDHEPDPAWPMFEAKHAKPGGKSSWLVVGFVALIVTVIAGFAYLRPGDKPPDNLKPTSAPTQGSVDIVTPDKGPQPSADAIGTPATTTRASAAPTGRASASAPAARGSAPAAAPRRNTVVAPPAIGSTHTLVNAASGNALAAGGSPNWTLRDADDGRISLVGGNGQCLDLPLFGRTNDGASLSQFPCVGASSQKWSLISAGDGTFQLRNQRSNLCLAAGDSAIQTDCGNGAITRWSFR
jgi:hypothetical protein